MMKKLGKALIASAVAVIMMVPTFAADTTDTSTKGDITVSYVSALDNTALKGADGQPIQKTVEAEIGKETTITAEPVDGYTVWGSTTEKVTLTPSNTSKVVTFKCYQEGAAANVGNVILYAKNIDTNMQIQEPITLVGVDMFAETNSSLDIDGYTFVRSDYVLKKIDGVYQLSYARKYKANEEVPTVGNITYECYTTDGTLLFLDTVESALGQVTVNAPTIQDCTVNGSATQNVFLTETAPVRTVKFTYDYTGATPLETTKNITYKYVDESGNVIGERIVNVPVGDVVTVDKSCTVSGYEVSDVSNIPSTVRYTAFSTGDTFTIKCRKVEAPAPTTGTIHITYFDTTNNVEISSEDVTKDFGTYTFDAKSFEGYTLAGDSQISVTISADSNTASIQFNYTKDAVDPNPPPVKGSVTINYVVQDTGAVISTETKSDLDLGDHTFNAIAFEGYTLVGDSTQTVTLTEASKDATITFYYSVNSVNPDPEPTPDPDPKPDPKPEEKPDTTGTVTICYQDVDGNALAPSETFTKLSLGNYSYSAKSFKGYNLVGNNTVSFSLTETNSKKSIVFTYKKIQVPGSISVVFVDESTGASLITSKQYTNLEYGSYTYSALKLDGYELVGDTKRTVTISDSLPSAIITFTYRKGSASTYLSPKEKEEKAKEDEKNIGVVTIKYVDSETGKEIETDKKFENLELKKYSYSAVNIKGYVLDDDVDKEVTLSKAKPSQEIVFKYKQSEDAKNNVVTSGNSENTVVATDLEKTEDKGSSKFIQIAIGALIAVVVFIAALVIGGKAKKNSAAYEEEAMDSEDEDDDDDLE